MARRHHRCLRPAQPLVAYAQVFGSKVVMVASVAGVIVALYLVVLGGSRVQGRRLLRYPGSSEAACPLVQENTL